MSRITQLTVDNVRRLTAVRITPKPGKHLVTIAGRNKQGKTSVLDSIAIGLRGPKESPEHPLHRGTDKAQIVIETEDLIIMRVYTEASGWSLVVRNRQGMKADAPQTLLDKLAGKHTFDPASFLRMDDTKQRETLMKLVGLDFSEEDADRQRLFDERTVINRRVKDGEAIVAEMPLHDDAPAKELNVADIAAEMEKENAKTVAAQALIDAAADLSRDAAAVKGELDSLDDQLHQIDLDIARLEKRRREVAASIATKQTEHTTLTAKAANKKKEADAAPRAELESLQKRASDAEIANKKVRENAARKKAVDLLATLKTQAADLTASIELLDTKKEKKLARTKFPIPGLSFSAGAVTLNGFALSEASAAEQLTVSVAMACAMNPDLRVMFVRDASLMDDESLALLNELAEKHDVQVWLERVGTKDKTAVIIEDGTNL